MNLWKCDDPTCEAKASGISTAEGLRGIGWFFEDGTDYKGGVRLLCPLHRPDNAPCTRQSHATVAGGACSQCAAEFAASIYRARKTEKISRAWAMPSGETCSILPIAGLVASHLVGHDVIVDPFAGNSRVGNYTNDLDPDKRAHEHLDAREFLQKLIDKNVVADAVIMDAPLSPRQTAEIYNNIGLKASQEDTQTGKTNRECRELIRKLLRDGGKVISFAWNSCGMGKDENENEDFERLETLIVAHGGNHNDAICVVERKKQKKQLPLF